jgi:superfamily II DNA helicase RecQ
MLIALAAQPLSAVISTLEYLCGMLLTHTRDTHTNFRMLTQLLALQQVVQRDFDVALVLLTASGKSLLYKLLGYIDVLSVTIIILPLIALLNEITTCCEQQHVHYTTWARLSSAAAPPVGASAPLVFAMAEQALLPVFSTWATALKVVHKLHRIIINEAHIMLTVELYQLQLLQL